MANRPCEAVQIAINAGKYKAGLSNGNYMVRGFMAGLLIAVGAALATVCGTGVEAMAPGLKSLIAGAVFPVGLIAIVLTAMELFTGDAMLLPISAMHKQVKWSKVW